MQDSSLVTAMLAAVLAALVLVMGQQFLNQLPERGAPSFTAQLR